MVRKFTCKLLEMADEGLISWQDLATCALKFMSENDVKLMAESNELIDDMEEEERMENRRKIIAEHIRAHANTASRRYGLEHKWTIQLYKLADLVEVDDMAYRTYDYNEDLMVAFDMVDEMVCILFDYIDRELYEECLAELAEVEE